MASEVDIANRALSMLGEERITSLDDNNKPARAMKARFVILRDAELSAYPWRFSVKRVQLAATTETPAWGFRKIYNRPVDDVRPISVGGVPLNSQNVGVFYESSGHSSTGRQSQYEIIEGRVETDLPAPLDYEYSARIEDTGQFDPLFVEALAARLAEDAAEELTQSKSKKEYAAMKYRRILAEARRVNSLYRPPRMRQDGGWMISRVRY